MLGDDDPEHNVPFSVERTKDRPESEEEHGGTAGRGRRQQAKRCAARSPTRRRRVIMDTPNLPVRLVLWGHYHAESGPP